MATKPARVFTWCTSVALGADPTQRLDIPASWKTNGVADTDRFLHEYANDTFGLISEWVSYIDDLDITQVKFATNGEFLVPLDTAGTVQLTLSHTGAGDAVITADIFDAVDGLFMGRLAAAPTQPITILAPVETDNTYAQLRLVHAVSSSNVGMESDVFLPRLRFADANPTTQVTALPTKTQYIENTVKAEAVIVVTTSLASIVYDSSTGGGVATSYGYNVKLGDTAPELNGNVIRVNLQDITELEGRVHATIVPGTSTTCGICKLDAFYNPVAQRVQLTASTTSTADLGTNIPIVLGGAINPALPAGTYTIHLLVF